MQKESTIQFWDNYHEENGEKEWLVQGNPDLLKAIYQNCSPSSSSSSLREEEEDGARLRILEIGCGTSAMARELWKYIDDIEQQEQQQQQPREEPVSNGRQLQPQRQRQRRKILIRSTDVSQVCIDSCWKRDKELPFVYGCGQHAMDGHGLEYETLDVQILPTKEQSNQWETIIDKACMDTFLFRSKNRGDQKNYPKVVLMALETIWSLLTNTGVYILLSPRSKIKPLRDFIGFSSVVRHEIRPNGVKCTIVAPKGYRQRDPTEVYYMYVCHKNLNYIVGCPNPFRLPLLLADNKIPNDDAICDQCGISFSTLRGRDYSGTELVWIRKWKNHRTFCQG